MKTFWIDIVGLTHCGVESYYKDYIEDSIGKRLTLLRDEMNPSDPFALKVKDRETTVGYVAATDLDIVHQALHATGRKRLTARVINISTDPPQLRAEVQCEAIDTDFDPYAQLPYEQWEWPALMLLPQSLASVSERADDLIELLESGQPDWNSVRALFLEFLTDSPSDTSREMNTTRLRVLQLLEQQAQQAATDEEHSRWLELALQLHTQKGQLMNHDTRYATARRLFILWPQQLKRQRFEQSHYTFDNRLDELEAQLQAFPFHLYATFLNDPVDFLRETFYKHVPRRQLYGLLSGIVLMVLKGRVSIRRWGRDDDLEMRRQLEDVVNFKEEETADRADRPDHTAQNSEENAEQNSAENSEQNSSENTEQGTAETADRADRPDQKTILKNALHRLLTEKGVTSKPLVQCQNQWAAIAYVLINEYDLPFELTDFCREMEAWGFGTDSHYPVPCVYSSVAKYSIYIEPNFEKREKKSLADKRQWAVVEGLRKRIAEEQAKPHSSSPAAC